MLVFLCKSVEAEVFVVLILHFCCNHIDLLICVVVLGSMRCSAFVKTMLVKHRSSFIVSGLFSEINSSLGQLGLCHRWSGSLKTKSVKLKIGYS